MTASEDLLAPAVCADDEIPSTSPKGYLVNGHDVSRERVARR
jgi:hypothetical protein